MAVKDHINEMCAKSYDYYGIDYHIGRDVFERIYLDGVNTGMAIMISKVNDFIAKQTCRTT